VLRWDAYVDDAMVNVRVANAHVTLDGTVGSLAEKNRAHRDAWVAGVRAVDSSELDVRWWARDDRLRTRKYVSRSDDEIEAAVNDAFLYDPRVYSFEIDVETDGGYVTLRGTVDTLKAKRAAARDARGVVGVWGVNNMIKVRPSNPSDGRIESNVEQALSRDPYVDRYEIAVSVVNGKAYLYGDVDTTYEKSRADDVASRQAGVREVRNFLTVNDPDGAVYNPYADAWYLYDYDWYVSRDEITTKTDWEIEEDIESELFWSPFVDSDDVTVHVENGRATLTGTVETWAEREAATENAFEGGAVIVDNDLAVEYGPDYYRP
jgi:osmotically-inducible protein OsmY